MKKSFKSQVGQKLDKKGHNTSVGHDRVQSQHA